MKKFTIAFLLAVIALCVVLAFVPDRIRKAVQASSGYGVAATTYPIWVLTREVLDGTGIEAQLLTPPDAGCPHDYVLTANDLMKVSAARKPLLLFKNGAGLDDHICKAALTANKGIVVVDTGAGIEVIGEDDHDGHDHEAEHHHDDGDDHDDHGEHDEHEEHEGEHGHEEAGHHHHHHGGENGHFFASPYEARKIVATIADELAKSDPVHANKFRENAAKLDKRLQILGDEFKSQLAPYASRHVAAQHNIFDYLLRDCGFEKPLAILADPETPPSPAEVTALTKEFKEHGVKVIFTEPQYPDELAKLIGKEAGAVVVKIDPVASGPADPPIGYYFDIMHGNLETMKKALAE
jgi:zinc/manganese transport system substrate-binding protein/zinc transport system substrate-binding protein